MTGLWTNSRSTFTGGLRETHSSNRSACKAGRLGLPSRRSCGVSRCSGSSSTSPSDDLVVLVWIEDVDDAEPFGFDDFLDM